MINKFFNTIIPFLLICNMIIPCFGQSGYQLILKTNDKIPGSKNLILIDNYANNPDTIAVCPSHFEIIDFVIKSEDSISLIFKEARPFYSYQQLVKDKETKGWRTDTMAMWQGPTWSPNLSSKDYKTEKYELTNYFQVEMTKDGQKIIINLPKKGMGTDKD